MLLFPGRHLRICDAGRFQIRKPKRQKELFQKRDVHSIDKWDCSDKQVFQHPQPERFLLLKEAQPAVKHGDSNAVMVTEPLYGSGTGKISPQYKQKETQGVRSVRDNTGRQDGMSMTAGIADMPLHSNCTAFLRIPIPFHQIPVIMPEEAQSPFRQAVWAGLVRRQGHPCCIFKPFPVRKFNLIQLAKNREPSYHKHG